MSSASRERSSSLFIISEGQFYSKPSIKLERLEKDFSDLKKKENEDEIELRRLRTENLLLKQRIDNLEKESATLADKLVQDKVAWAQEVEQMYAVRTRLSIALRQFRESQNQLHDSENTIEELNKKNRVCTDQMRRVAAENKKLKKMFEEITQDKKALQTHINTLTRKLDDTESIRKEEAIIARIKDAEHMQQMAELRRKLAEIDIQKVEKLAMGQIRDHKPSPALVTSSSEFQNQQPTKFIVPGMSAHHGHQKMTDSQSADNSEVLADCGCTGNSDDEFDALIKDSENLERTLLDIIEGRGNSSAVPMRDAEGGTLSDSRNVLFKSNISSSGACVTPNITWRQTNMAAQDEAGTCVSRKFAGDTVVGLRNDICDGKVVGIANVDATSDGKVVGIANVDATSDGKVVGIATVDGRTDDKSVGIAKVYAISDDNIVGIVNVDATSDGKVVGIAKVDATSDGKVVGIAKVDDTSDDKFVGIVNVDDTSDGKVIGTTHVDATCDDKAACIANVYGRSDNNIVGVVNIVRADGTIVGEASVDGLFHENTACVANVGCANDTCAEITVGLASDDNAGEKIVGLAKTYDFSKEKVVIGANNICVDVTQCDSRFRRGDELEHGNVVYGSHGSAGAVLSLFGYKGEASLMLKESAI